MLLEGVQVQLEDAGSVVFVDVTAPEGVSLSSLDLNVHEGLLRITLPKAPPALASHERTEPEYVPHRVPGFKPDASGV